jgi:hypothetical protein
MRVIAFIENEEVIKKFSNIWVCGMLKGKEAPKIKAPPLTAHTEHSDSHLPSCEDYFYCDPD